MESASLKIAAAGRWGEIIASVCGVERHLFSTKGKPCPLCGGTDRFAAFKDFEETGGCICRKCRPECNSDGFATIQWLSGCSFPEAVQLVAEYLGIAEGSASRRPKPNQRGESPKRIVATYDYREEQGELLFQVVRFEPKGFRQRRPREGGNWDWAIKGVRQVPYRLTDFLERQGDEAVFIVEGEKDVDRLYREGLVASCNAGGAAKGDWSSWATFFKGRHVALLPDNDEPGRKHAQCVAGALHGAARSIKIVELPGLPEKGDVSDWLDAGRTVDELRRLVDAAAEFDPKQEAAKGWGTPIALASALPVFPVERLPDSLRAWVSAEAEATQTPVDLFAMLSLAVVATATAGAVEIEGTPGWIEPVNLFATVVLPPGSRKSAVFSDVVRPLQEYERAESERLAESIRAERTEREILEKRRSYLMSAASKVDDAAERDRIREQLSEIDLQLSISALTSPRLFADDVTPEKVAELLHQHGGRMALLSAEGGVFDVMKGRYSDRAGANIDVYLKGHSGDTLRVDRIGRESNAVDKPALTMGLAIQPSVLQDLSDARELQGKGLLARILYAIPENTVGRRRLDATPMSSCVRDAYEHRIRQLCEGRLRDEPMLLRLDPSAAQAFRAFREWIEPRLAPEGELGHMADWSSKLPGAVLRIAALLYCAEHGFESRSVKIETMDAALAIGRYLIEHANAAFRSMGGRSNTSSADLLLKRIVETEASTFTRRELFERVRGQVRFQQSEDLKAPLEILVEHGWIRRLEDDRKGPGRPREVYEIHPIAAEMLRSQAANRHPQNTRKALPAPSPRNSADIADAPTPLEVDSVKVSKHQTVGHDFGDGDEWQPDGMQSHAVVPSPDVLENSSRPRSRTSQAASGDRSSPRMISTASPVITSQTSL